MGCATEATPFLKELLERISRIREQRAASPDLSGFELAFDRGNITADELDAIRTKIDRCQRLIEEETAHIEALAAYHTAAFDGFLAESAAQLRRILADLNREGTADAFAQRFARSLIPDLIAGLEARKNRQPDRHAFSWLLCATVDVLQEAGELAATAETAS